LEIGEQAIQRFLGGRNCAEAVSWAVLTHYKLDEQQTELISHAAAGFGGGIASSGHICGAVSGTMLALSTLSMAGIVTQEKPRQSIKGMGKRFIADFEQEFGSCDCKDLTGCDFWTEEGNREFKEKSLKQELCINLVSWATDRMSSLLNNASTTD
jgi:C_GCAxxG_C_C family probable redox protein